MEGDNKERNNEREKEETKDVIDNEEGTKETQMEGKRQKRTVEWWISFVVYSTTLSVIQAVSV